MPLERNNPSKIVSKARENFNRGLTRNPTQRIQFLKSLLKFLKENEEEIIRAILADVRKHREEARLEILLALSHINYLIDNFQQWICEKLSKRWVDVLDGLYVYHEPYGVALVMCTWNVPLLTVLPAAGAIAAGNCVVIKLSHNAPNFGYFLSTTLPKYLNPECFPVFSGNAEETRELLEERFDYIYYAGTTAFGKTVHLAANKYLTPTTLELGGKNPVYIDPSADLELAATRIMWGKCFTSGQACIAPDYLLCNRSIEKDFIKHATAALDRFYKNDYKYCPIVNDHHFKRLQNWIDGLTIAAGGRTNPSDNSVEPTIVVDVPSNHPIINEETFGPILPILPVSNYKEAVEYINRGEKPLIMYIFTEDMAIKDYFIENTPCGGITVNDTLTQMTVEELPLGGVGSSGMGRYKGKDSFNTFSYKKSVLVKNTWRIIERIYGIRYPPYSRQKTKMVEFFLRRRQGPSWIGINYVSVFLIGLSVGLLLYYVNFQV